MQPETLIRILDALPEKSAGWHGFQRLSVKRCSSKAPVTDGAVIEALLVEWADAAGWIARESGVIVRPAPDNPALGSVIEAELGLPACSLRIRRLGNGWVWTRYDEVGGGEMLADDVVLVTIEGKGARHRRYWTLPADGAAEIGWYRLVGLEELE